MKRFLSVLSLLLFLAGLASLFLTACVGSEPILVFQVGFGAGIFVVLLLLATLIQVGIFAYSWGIEQATQKVTHMRDESYRQFLRRLDHELKNPLTGLQAALTNLRETENHEDTLAAIDNATQAASRLRGILRDLRKLGELDARILEHRPVEMDDLVCEMVNAANSLPVYKGRNIKLLISKIPPLPIITGDRDLLGLAIYNLLDNALKYSTSGDAIEMRVREDGRALFIEVADSGAGIQVQDQERIFEDLYRGQNARETDGSGLGLTLARRIIQLHRGEITLRSNPAQVHGTVFTIRLPLS
jgi:two-component system OmpR family sensor kinase